MGFRLGLHSPGTTIGVAGATLAFARTAGRIVRLHVLDAAGAPTIWDFELYAAAPGRSFT